MPGMAGNSNSRQVHSSWPLLSLISFLAGSRNLCATATVPAESSILHIHSPQSQIKQALGSSLPSRSSAGNSDRSGHPSCACSLLSPPKYAYQPKGASSNLAIFSQWWQCYLSPAAGVGIGMGSGCCGWRKGFPYPVLIHSSARPTLTYEEKLDK